MNRIYKTVWNELTGTFVAVSEHVKGRGKRSGSSVRRVSRVGAVVAGVLGLAGGVAHGAITVGAGANVGEFDGNTIVFSSNGTITGLGNGAVSAGSTDAVNGAQLFAVSQAVNLNTNAVTALQQGWTLKTGTTTKSIQAGDTVEFAAGNNIEMSQSGGTVTVRTKDNLAATSLTTTGNVGVGGTLNVTGATTLGGGLAMNTQKITGLAAGTNASDAVNLQQLQAVGGSAVNYDDPANKAVVTLEGMGGTLLTNLAAGAETEFSKDAVTGAQMYELRKELFEQDAAGIRYFRALSGKVDAKATGDDAIAIGPEAEAEGEASIAAGLTAVATGDAAVAVGLKSEARAENAVALGTEAKSHFDDGVAIGTRAKAAGDHGLALGTDAEAGANAIAGGQGAQAAGGGVAFGTSSSASANALAMGPNALAIDHGIALGLDAQARTGNSISIGEGAGFNTTPTVNTLDVGNVAIGTRAGQRVDGEFNTAIGNHAGEDVDGAYNVALGYFAGTGMEGKGNISIGQEANKEGEEVEWSVALGAHTRTSGDDSIAIGTQAATAGQGAIALGRSSEARSANAVAIGQNAVAIHGSGVALGANSRTENMVGAPVAYLTGTTAPASAVSVGSSSGTRIFQRRISNVAGGALDHDAVNVAQLKSMQEAVKDIVGEGATIGADGKLAYSYNGVSTISAAIGVAGGGGGGGTAPGDAVLYDGASMESVTLGGGAAGTQIRNVAAGSQPNHAVNKQQLDDEVAANKLRFVSINSTTGANHDNEGATGENAIAVGAGAFAKAHSGTAVGQGAWAGLAESSIGATAIGTMARAQRAHGTALGDNSQALQESGVAVGHDAMSNGARGIAMGYKSIIGQGETDGEAADDGVAIGTQAVVTRKSGIALGHGALSEATSAIAQGTGAHATGVSSMALGVGADASGLDAIAMGSGAGSAGTNSTAIGTLSEAHATDSIAMGTMAVADSGRSLAMGVGAHTGKTLTVLNDKGVPTLVTYGGSAAAIGDGSTAIADSSVALGQGAHAGNPDPLTPGAGVRAMALGAGSQAYAHNSVALGPQSATKDAYTQSTAAFTGTTNNDASSGVISVGRGDGDGGITGSLQRRITNVAGGQDGTDAVNVDQLTFVRTELIEMGTNYTGNEGSQVHRDLGETLRIAGTGTTAGNYSGRNLKTVTDPVSGQINLQMAENPVFSNVTTSGLVVNSNSTINMGSNKVTNVADGTAAKDAVNLSQLQTVANTPMTFQGNTGSVNRKLGETLQIIGSPANTNISTSVVNNEVHIALSNNLTADQLTINDGGPVLNSSGVNMRNKKITGLHDGEDDKDAVNLGQLKNSAWTVSVSGGAPDSIKKDDNLDFAPLDSNTSIAYNPTDKKMTIGVVQSPTFTNVTTGGLNVTPGAVINMGGNQVKGVAAGSDSTDAVNYGQLSALANQPLTFAADVGAPVERKLGQTLNVKGGTSGNIQTTTELDGIRIELAKALTADSLTINGGPVVNNSGINMNSKKITGLADGVADDDAVNMGQLNDVSAVANKGWHLTAQGADSSNVKPDGIVDLSNGDGNILVAKTAADNNVTFDLAKDIAVDSVTTGGTTMGTAGVKVGSDVVLGSTGLTAGTVAVSTAGINAGGYTVSNVKAGVADTDAVNVAQLKDSSWTISAEGGTPGNIRADDNVDFRALDTNTSVAYDDTTKTMTIGVIDTPSFTSVNTGALNVTGVSTLAGGAVIGNHLTVNAGTAIDMGENQVKNVAAGTDDLDAVNVSQLKDQETDLTTKGMKFAANVGAPVHRELGQTLGIVGGLTDPSRTSSAGNIRTTVVGDQIQIELADNLNIVSLTAGDTFLDTSGVRIGPDVVLDGSGLMAGGVIVSSLTGIDAGGFRITNLAPGVDDTDAVNVSQLKDVESDLADLDERAVKYDLNPDNTVNYGHITLAGPTSADGGLTGGTRITNLAQGEVSEFSTDAINGAQLYGVQMQVDENTTNIANLDGRVTTIEGDIGDISRGGAGMFQVSQDHNAPAPTPTGTNSVAGGAGAVASGNDSMAVGNDSLASGDQSLALGTNSEARGTGDVALGHGSLADRGPESYEGKYSGAQNDTSGTVSVGNAETGETRTISNVADGREATDAVNLRQLDGAVQEAKDYTDTQIANITVDIDQGSVGMFQVSQDHNAPTPQPTGEDSAAGGAGAVASGKQSTAVGNNAVASGDQSTAMGNGAQATGNNSVALGQGSIADQDDTVSVGAPGAERRIVNVAAGEISSTSTDAINGSQLHETNTNVTNIVEGKAGLVQQQTPKGEVTVAAHTGGTVVNMTGTDGDRRITGVADGRAPNDAVNVNQLNQLGSAMGNQVNRLDNRINKVENRSNAGVAAALATAGLPQAYLPGKSMFSVAGGTWNGESGYAMGLSTVSDNGKWVLKGTASGSSRGDYGGSVGVGYQW